MSAIFKLITIWSAFIPVAIVNGIFRDMCLVPFVGGRLALPLSGVSCSILFFLLTYRTLDWVGPLKQLDCWMIGVMWLVLTVLFEFLFGRLVAHKSWGELLQAYDLTSGNLWMVVLIVIVLSPYLAAKVRRIIA